MFAGFTEDTYSFLWELAFHNDQSFFEANRARYKRVLYEPLFQLTETLIPTVRDIDDRLNLRPSSTISRIRRDTRYTKDKSPYRDHAWLGYKMADSYVSESFCIYAEIEREGYGYGMGMYAPEPRLMQMIRDRILARPQKFLSLVNETEFARIFTLNGVAYKRPKYPDAAPELAPYLNLRSMSFSFYSTELKSTLKPALADEIEHGFVVLKPVYRFVMGLD